MKKYKKITLIFSLFAVSLSVLAFGYAYSSILKNNVDVSVIVPIYNVEKYLDECLNSIENQTKQDGVEIICVNDGSKDNSFEILKSHAEKDKRIKVISQENRGLSAARNEGMKKAKGKYIMFVDSDDLIVPYAIEKAYKLAEENDADMVKFEAEGFQDGTYFDLNKFVYDDSKISILAREEHQNPFEIWGKADPEGVAWNKFWKRSFLQSNNMSFKEGVKFEDVLFNWIALPKLFKVVVDENVSYGYRQNRPGSIMSDMANDAVKCLENNVTIVEEILSKRDEIKFDEHDNWLIRCVLVCCHENICSKLKDEDQKRYYSNKYLSIIDDFVNKYDVSVSTSNNDKIAELRSLADR